MEELTGSAIMTSDDVWSTDWELLINLKPRSVLKSISSPLFSEV